MTERLKNWRFQCKLRVYCSMVNQKDAALDDALGTVSVANSTHRRVSGSSYGEAVSVLEFSRSKGGLLFFAVGIVIGSAGGGIMVDGGAMLIPRIKQ